MLLGNQFSFGFVFASAALQGVFAELPFALTRYRVFNLPISMASGALVALEYGVYLMLFRYRGVSFLSPRGVIHMISELVGGVLIAGVMSWYLYRAIAATGALDRFASGRALRGRCRPSRVTAVSGRRLSGCRPLTSIRANVQRLARTIGPATNRRGAVAQSVRASDS